MRYNLLTTCNGDTIDETPIDSISHGIGMLEALTINLKRNGYFPIVTHNGTGIVYTVEELCEGGADNKRMEIGIVSC